VKVSKSEYNLEFTPNANLKQKILHVRHDFDFGNKIGILKLNKKFHGIPPTIKPKDCFSLDFDTSIKRIEEISLLKLLDK
jgi:hypothetical protein